jgi:predicted nucleic acid-binding protein
MILIDSSAWIEFLRGTGSPACDEVDRLLESEISITDPVLMEVLAGARDRRHLQQLRALLGGAHMRHCAAADFEPAALLYRRWRSGRSCLFSISTPTSMSWLATLSWPSTRPDQPRPPSSPGALHRSGRGQDGQPTSPPGPGLGWLRSPSPLPSSAPGLALRPANQSLRCGNAKCDLIGGT